MTRSKHGRRGALAALALVVGLAVAAPASADPGELDPTFGTDGSVPLVGGSPLGVVTGPDDGWVATTTDFDAATPTITLARFDATGRPDPTFGGGTVVLDARGAASPDDVQVVVDASDRLVVATIEERSATLVLRLRRLAPDGSPDATFGEAGEIEQYVLADITDVLRLGAVAPMPDGRLVVALSLNRVTPDGRSAGHLSVLADFDGSGALLGATPVSLTASARAAGFPTARLAVEPGGGILHAEARDGAVAVRRFGSELDHDASFGDDGAADPGLASTGPTGVVALRVDDDGVLVASSNGVVRLDGSGAVDPTWTFDGAGLAGPVVDVADGADGTVVVATGSLRQLDPAGRPVAAFGVDGTAVLDGSTATAGVLVDNRIVVVGVDDDGPSWARAYEPAPHGTAVVIVEDPLAPRTDDRVEDESASTSTTVADVAGPTTTVADGPCSAASDPAVGCSTTTAAGPTTTTEPAASDPAPPAAAAAQP